MNDDASNEREGGLLREIGGLHDRVRALRQSPKRDSAQIKALEGEARSKWEELRRLRAGPVTADATQLTPRGLRR
jgi:hypothetical protein